MYEWENEVSSDAVNSRIHWLRVEIKRISNTTLRGNFVNEEDRGYWVKRLKSLTSELSEWEQQQARQRKG